MREEYVKGYDRKKQKERHHSDDLEIDGKIILKRILEK
jgi:hypothetical protein